MCILRYGVATISRMLTTTCLFAEYTSLLCGSFALKTYILSILLIVVTPYTRRMCDMTHVCVCDPCMCLFTWLIHMYIPKNAGLVVLMPIAALLAALLVLPSVILLACVTCVYKIICGVLQFVA